MWEAADGSATVKDAGSASLHAKTKRGPPQAFTCLCPWRAAGRYRCPGHTPSDRGRRLGNIPRHVLWVFRLAFRDKP
jgi:hypothetical protein